MKQDRPSQTQGPHPMNKHEHMEVHTCKHCMYCNVCIQSASFYLNKYKAWACVSCYIEYYIHGLELGRPASTELVAV